MTPRSLAAWVPVLLVLLSGRAPAQDAPRPNVIVVMADDLGWSDVGCYGGEIATPNLDALAATGVRFTRFYNTGRCCPTRASLLTGQYPHRAGIGHMMRDRGHDGYRGELADECPTVAEALGAHGYRCYMTGKWHVTRHTDPWSGNGHDSRTDWPMQRGFDRFWGTIHGGGSYWNPVSLTDGNTPIRIPDGEPFYYTDAISEKAARYVREHHGDGPFFLYVAYTAPHWPLHAWPGDIARYEGRYAEGWDAVRAARHRRQRELELVDPAWPLSPRGRGIPDWTEAPHPAWQQRAMEVYAAMVDRMDQGVGRIVTALEDTGRLDDTLFLFLSDNGGCAEGGRAFETPGYRGGLSRKFKRTRAGEPIHFGHYAEHMPGPPDTYQEYGRPWANVSCTPFRLYKHFVHEGGIASPLIAHWPAGLERQGVIERQPAHVIDLVPTILALAGAGMPGRRQGHEVPELPGVDLTPALRGAALPDRILYWEHEGNRAVLDEPWKLVARGRKGPWELYDLSADRTEVRDRAAEHPERVAELAALWQDWARRNRVLPWPE